METEEKILTLEFNVYQAILIASTIDSDLFSIKNIITNYDARNKEHDIDDETANENEIKAQLLRDKIPLYEDILEKIDIAIETL